MNNNLSILIAGGSGFIGQALIKRWQATQRSITVLGRDPQKIDKLFDSNVKTISWQQFDADPQAQLSDIDVIVNLCGANIGAKLWTKKRREQLLASRVNTTCKLASACATLGSESPRLLNASAIGIYGLQRSCQYGLSEAVNENTDVSNHSDDFLSEIGRAWEAELHVAEQADVHVVKMRFGVVLDRNGGALPRIAMPFKFGLGGPVGDGHQAFTWISLDDLCCAIEFLIDTPNIEGPVNLVAPKCISQLELAHALGRVLHRPSFMPLPAFVVKTLFGEMGNELLLQGQHVVPTRLLREGFKFQHPDIDTALTNIYQ